MTHWTDDTDGSAQTWSGTGSAAQSWSDADNSVPNLWNTPEGFSDTFGGIDFRPVIGGGWIIGGPDQRNTIRIGETYMNDRP